MSEDEKNRKKYDLEERTMLFAKNVRAFVRTLPKTVASIEDSKQVIRSSGSIGANYIEANEALSRKDFGMRIKICRKEAKESRYWLHVLDTVPDALSVQHGRLVQEATELLKIFNSIVQKV